jgi:hypothetical protein
MSLSDTGSAAFHVPATSAVMTTQPADYLMPK